jgi:hypothetical protein
MSITYGQVADSKERRITRVCMRSLHLPVDAACMYSSPLLWSLRSGESCNNLGLYAHNHGHRYAFPKKKHMKGTKDYGEFILAH